MRSRHLFVIIASCLLFMLSQGVAYADRRVDKLQKQAMEAFKAGNYDQAELLFKSALQIEPSDVLWLNLGRTYMRQNRCLEAKNAYGKVNLRKAKSAVREKYEEYQRDLRRTCACEVQFICTEPNSQVFVDNLSADGLCGDKVYLTPGIHHFREDSSSGSVTSIIELKSDGVLSTVDFVTALQVQQEQQAAEEALRAATQNQIDTLENEVSGLSSIMYSRMRIAGYSLIGSGVALALVGGIWMGADFKDSNDKFEKIKSNPSDKDYNYNKYKTDFNDITGRSTALTAVIVVGSLAAVAGGILTALGHVLDRPGSQEDSQSADGVSDAGEVTAIRIQPVFSVSPAFSGGGIEVSF